MGSVMALAGCGNVDAPASTATVPPQPSQLAATTMPTASPRPTLTETPSSTPTVTPTAGPSPTPAPTPAFGSARVGNDFLFGNQPEGCELPCWQGLVVGKSNIEDVQSMFDTAFGLNDSYDFVETTNQAYPPGIVVAEHSWQFVPGRELFAISVWFDETDQLTEAIDFMAVSPEFERYTSPQRILRELGMPSYGLMSIGRTEIDTRGTGRLMFFYFEQGFSVLYTGIPVWINTMNTNDFADDTAQICMNTLSSGMGHYTVHVYLTQPFPDGLIKLSPIQDFLIGTLIKTVNPPLMPFEEGFGLDLAKTANLVQQQDNACLSTAPTGVNW